MHTESSSAGIGAADPLLAQAGAWIAQLRGAGEDILLYPVSRLQRQFRLGYSRSCALAQALVHHGEWMIGFTEDGTRYARLVRLAQELPA